MNRVKKFIRNYNDIEIKSMNNIFGKNVENNWFTQEELSFASDFNLLDNTEIEKAKQDWIACNLA